MKVLQVIGQAFRTTVEEQDDTILWLTQAMQSAAGNLSVLLTGHGAYYALEQGRQPALAIGAWQQAEPAELSRDIAGLVDKGVPVYVLREDLQRRGLADLPLQKGVEVIGRDGLVQIYEEADQVWQW